MKASVVAAASCLVSAQEAQFPKPPKSLIDFGLGLVDGVVSDKGDAVSCVLPGIAPMAHDGIAAAEDFVKAVKTHDDALLMKSVGEVVDTCKDIPNLLEKCDAAHTDVLGIMDVLKQIHGPKELVKHIADDVKHDFDHIFAELGAALKAFREKKYDDFGRHLGMFLHRLVIGKFTEVPADGYGAMPGPVKNLIAFAVPFASYLVSDKPDLLFCAGAGLPIMGDLQQFAKDFKEALKDHNMTALTASVKDISGACEAIGDIKGECEPLKEDLSEIARVMKTIDNVAALLDHLLKNVEKSGGKIESDLDLAFKAFVKKPRDYSGIGEHLGKAVHRLVIEEYPDETVIAKTVLV